MEKNIGIGTSYAFRKRQRHGKAAMSGHEIIKSQTDMYVQEDTMKTTMIAMVLTLGLVTAGLAYGGMGSGMMGSGYSGMGQGMMGSGYSGMGPGATGYSNGNGNGYGGGGYGWNGYRNNSNSPQSQKFLNDTVELRRQLNDRRFEYQEALRNPNTSREQLAQLESEINDLQAKINYKAQQDQ